MNTQSRKNTKLKQGIQKKAFTAWANSIFEKHGSSSKINDLFKNLRNGHLLGELLENLSGERLRLVPGKSRSNFVDNLETCIDFLDMKDVSTRSIDSEDIVDGCPDTTLELMWAIITGLYINKKELLKAHGRKTVEEALLVWARNKTKRYNNVRIKDYTGASWKDGLAFLALIDAHRPGLVHLKDFHNDERRFNLQTAFEEAQNELRIPSLLDVEDLMKSQVEERSVATYIACFYRRFGGRRNKMRGRNGRSEYSRDDDDSSDARSDSSDASSSCSEDSSHRTSRTSSSGNKHERKDDSRTSSSRTSSSASNSFTRGGNRRRSRNSSSSSSTPASSLERGEGRRNKKGGTNSVDGRHSVERPKKTYKTKANKSKRSDDEEHSPAPGSSHSRKGHRRDGRNRSLDTELSPGSSRRRRNRRGHSRDGSHSSSPDTRGEKNREGRRRYDLSPELSRDREKNKEGRRRHDRSPESRRDRERNREDFHVRERRRSYSRGRNRSSSNSDHDNEYPRDNGARFYTLGHGSSGVKKPGRKSTSSSHLPEDWSQIVEEISRLSGPRGFPRNDPADGEDIGLPFAKLSEKRAQNIPLVPSNPTPVQFEWQFQNEHGVWVSYGAPNPSGVTVGGTATTSDDIENYFVAHPNSGPVRVRTTQNSYELNFGTLRQTNEKTSVQRPIRRIPKLSPNITPVNASAGVLPQAGPSNQPPVNFEWQFEDEHGSWIPYGRANSAGNVSHATTTSSDDIERHYAANQANPTPIAITSNNNSRYVLDLKNLTQTNQHTSVQRRIRRVPKSSPANTPLPKGSKFVWSFKDEHDNWVRYGNASSANQANSATTTTSDDIERKYLQNPTGILEIASGQHKYLIDFRTRTQTNIGTKVVRAIRRVLVTASDLPSSWAPMKPTDNGLTVVLLNPTDAEYKTQEAFVKKTLPTNHTITKLYRIQNEHLWKDYLSRKSRLKERYPNIQYKELTLFHGTDPKHVKSICAENLDFRLNGTNGTVYGQGTYFATSAAYSARYGGQGPTKLMFLVKVLVGQYAVGSSALRRPPKHASGPPCDATVDNASNPSIYVKYNNAEYYPEYYIEFT